MKLMILDGNSVINRAYYGVHPLTTRDGMYTNAIFGFLNILERVRREERPEALCVAFDLHGPTFRHLKYEAYKANRHGMPEELAAQMPVMKDVLRAMNIPIYECQGWEADDVIGTVSRLCADADWDCVILTGDRDSLQLVNDRVTVKLVRTQGGQTRSVNYDPATFEAEYGLEPIRLIDLKALMGDSSDNIPGVAGVGPKTATELLHRFGTLDGIYENLTPQNMKGKLYEKLVNGREMAYLSYELATIRCDAPLCFEFSPEKNLVREPKRRELYDLFTRLEFQKLIDQYGLRSAAFETPETDAAEPPEAKCDVVTAETADEALALLDGAPVAVAASPELDTVAVCRDAAVTLLKRERLGLDHAYVLERLFDRAVPKTAHDVKPLMRRLLAAGIDADGFVFDTALAAYLVDATAGKYDLPRLFVSYYNEELPKPAHLQPDAFSPLAGDVVPAQTALLSYTAAVSALYETLLPKLRDMQLEELYYQVELPLCRVLADMEIAGFPVDRKELAAFGAVLQEATDRTEQAIYQAAGEKFNINSPRQLGRVLFEKLQLPHGKKTKTGWSTNADVLEKLRYDSPIVEDVLQYRQYTKLKSTYVDGLMKVIDPDGRVSTSFQRNATATGRLSSTEPNLQNIPTRTELGSQLRRMFTAGEGCVLVDADYSQIELRLLAHISGDEAMRESFLSGTDFHTATAARVFHVAKDEVTPELRRRAKAVNFGVVYGISAFSLSQDIGVSVAEAREYMERYFETYSTLRQYMTDVVVQAEQDGYVQTMMHRRRALPELKSSNHNLREFGKRVALNMPVQGTAADIMKLAMVRVHDRLRREGLRGRLLMQVHDELIVECPEEEREQVERVLTEEMEHAAELSVPLTTDVHWGRNWLEAKG